MRIMAWITDLLFPDKCVLCGRILKTGEQDLCQTCREETEPYHSGKSNPHFLDSVAAVWYYEGKVRKSLLRFKFYNGRSLAVNFGRLLAMKLIEEAPRGFDLITWVPISSLRRLRRGYDQVELLAGEVGRELGQSPVPLLKKTRHNRSQSRLSGAAARRANVRGVYRYVGTGSLEGKKILLLDDILTTGATAGEAARILRMAGAEEVHCAVIAAARKE